MMARGGTGTVKGIGAERVRKMLLDWHDHVYGESFKPRGAAAFFEQEFQLTEDQAIQLAHAYVDVHGVNSVPGEHGMWRAGPRVRPLLEHRDWRLTTGRLDLAGVRYLAERTLQGAPESVCTLQERCRRALRQLQKQRSETDDD